jgi:hypothetical protein
MMWRKSYLGSFSVTQYWNRTLKQSTIVSYRIFHIHKTSSNELRVERISGGTKKRSAETQGGEQYRNGRVISRHMPWKSVVHPSGSQ